MYNWSVDEELFKKRDPKAYRQWRITQMINYGLDEEKLNEKEVKKLWPQIRDRLDPHKTIYLEYLLWNKRPSSRQFTKSFWNLS